MISHTLHRTRSKKGTVVLARGSRQDPCATLPTGSAALAPDEDPQQRTMSLDGSGPGREVNNESDGREKAAEEKVEGSERPHASLHPSPPSSPSSSYSSLSSSSSSLTTTCSSASSPRSSCSPSSPLLRPAWAVIPASLDEERKVDSKHFAATPASPASSSLSTPLCLADNPSEADAHRHADGSIVPAPQATGFRRMPRDPGSGRRICFYFNHTGCSAGARCVYAHTKMDISRIIPGTFYKPVVPSTPSLPPSHLFSGSSPRATDHPHHHYHPPTFPVGATRPPFPASLPTYMAAGPPPLPGAPAYVMYYVCVPPSCPPSLPPAHRPAFPPYFYGDATPRVPLVRGGSGEERIEGSWRDRQAYHHPVEQEQQASAAMEAGWEGRPMEVRSAELRYHHQDAHYQQQQYYYPYQQQQQEQQQSEYR